MMAEYKELTAPFGRLRGFLPLMSSGFIMAIFGGLFLLIDSIFSIVHVNSAVRLNENSLTMVAFVIILETFLSFFLPMAVPMSRFTMEGREFDLLLSLPIKTWHVLLGIFLAEAILSLPLFVLTGTGSIFLLSYLIFQDFSFTASLTILSFILMFLLSITALWLGLLITRFLTQVHPTNLTKPAFNLLLSITGILLIIIIDTIYREGLSASRQSWLQSLPPIQASFLIITSITTKKVDLLAQSSLMITFLMEITLILAVSLLIAFKLSLQPSNETKFFIGKEIHQVINLSIPEWLHVDWILFKRFLRDSENLSRLVLSLVLSLTILFIFQKFIMVNIPKDQSQARLMALLVDAVTIFGFLGMISIIAFLESSFFAMEARENIFLFLTIPKSLRTIMTKKVIQIELQMVIITTMITVIGGMWQLLPREDVILAWFTLVILGIPIPLILLGIYQLNPPSDEQDVTHLFNSLIFFMFLLASQFFIIFLVFLLQTTQMVTVLIISFLFILIGSVLFYLGLQNLEQYDLGKGTGPYTETFRSLLKITGLFVITHLMAILTAIVSIRLVYSVLSFIIGFYIPYIIMSAFLTARTRKEPDVISELERKVSPVNWKKIHASLIGIIILGIMMNVLFPSALLELEINNRLLGQFNLTVDENITTSFFYQILILTSQVSFILVFTAIIEEIFYRKTLIDYLERENFSSKAILVISSVFFTIAHATIMASTLLTSFLLGLILASTYLKNKSLKDCIRIHLTYNSLIMLLTIFTLILPS